MILIAPTWPTNFETPMNIVVADPEISEVSSVEGRNKGGDDEDKVTDKDKEEENSCRVNSDFRFQQQKRKDCDWRVATNTHDR